MQIFIPYKSPLACAMVLDTKRFNKQILETKQILTALSGHTKGYLNHPVTKMYASHQKWLRHYLKTFEMFQEGNIMLARIYSKKADMCRPKWMDDELCDQHKRRLHTKRPDLYPQWDYLGFSDENWYIVDGETRKYINGNLVK